MFIITFFNFFFLERSEVLLAKQVEQDNKKIEFFLGNKPRYKFQMSIEKIEEDLREYLNKTINMSVITIDFKNLYKFDEELLQHINKFHDENKKIIGSIETILKCGKLAKYCSVANKDTQSVYESYLPETFSRQRTYSDHPKLYTNNDLNVSLNNLNIDNVPEFPTAEAKENTGYFDSYFDKEPVKELKEPVKETVKEPVKFNDIYNNVQPFKKPIDKTPVDKKLSTYTPLIEIRPSMLLESLDNEFKEFIKNPEDFKDVKFYYTNTELLGGNKTLYIYRKQSRNYFIADDGKLYELDPENQLVQAIYDSKLQYWKKQMIF
jgi:hypothetical protein